MPARIQPGPYELYAEEDILILEPTAPLVNVIAHNADWDQSQTLHQHCHPYADLIHRSSHPCIILHRVVNGNGRIEREYAIGSRRLDLCLFYGNAQLAMELKVWRDGEPDPLAQGLGQLDLYLSGLGLATG